MIKCSGMDIWGARPGRFLVRTRDDFFYAVELGSTGAEVWVGPYRSISYRAFADCLDHWKCQLRKTTVDPAPRDRVDG